MSHPREDAGRGPYGAEFHASHAAGSRTSAEVVLPILLAQIGPVSSLVDIGGGIGTWAAVAGDLGVPMVRVIDGAWVDPRQLQVPADCFSVIDLESDDLSRLGRFDLAICLEVAEHLSPERGASLVAEMCSLADMVFFSAAIPGQGGREHTNERWLTHWQELFACQGYGLSDPVRPHVWTSPQVEWWYAQNAVLFSKDAPLDHGGLVDVVHPRLWEQTRGTSAFRLATRGLSLLEGLPDPILRAMRRASTRGPG